MAYKCDGEWHIEAADLDALRRTILRMYGSTFPSDVPAMAQARVHDRLNPPDFTKPKGNLPVKDESLIITAERHDVWQGKGSNRARYHAWRYDGITVALYQVL
jgi:hypothetical protein